MKKQLGLLFLPGFFVLVSSFVSGVEFLGSDDESLEAGGRQFGALLDGNRDGRIDPYEALDVLLALEEELDGSPIRLESLDALLREIEREELDEVEALFGELDADGDGRVALTEMDPEMRPFAQLLDEDQDGFVTALEAVRGDLEEEIFMTEEEIETEVGALFREFDLDGDDFLRLKEVGEEGPWEEFREADSNDDRRVSREEMRASLRAEASPARFRVEGTTAFMAGVINSGTPAEVLRLIVEHPGVRTIEMTRVPGSIDDEANLRAAAFVRRHEFTTLLKSGSRVASGGVDFFLAGAKRIVEKGASLGIHSWGGPGFQGREVPADHPQHRLYLDYYRTMGISEAFYWRTLEAAPADGIHWMTEEELTKFRVRTE